MAANKRKSNKPAQAKAESGEKPLVIRIGWDGESYRLPDFAEREKPLMDNHGDWGIYQIYGEHPVYGSDTLLYIGLCGERADTKQTLGERISQHPHFRDAYFKADVYVGRLIGENPDIKTDKGQQEWTDHIRWAEKLLVFFHAPAHNSQHITGRTVANEFCDKDVRVFNFGNYRKLLGEVSSDYFREYNEEYIEDKFKPYRFPKSK